MNATELLQFLQFDSLEHSLVNRGRSASQILYFRQENIKFSFTLSSLHVDIRIPEGSMILGVIKLRRVGP